MDRYMIKFFQVVKKDEEQVYWGYYPSIHMLR
jgi:hypothetical protein